MGAPDAVKTRVGLAAALSLALALAASCRAPARTSPPPLPPQPPASHPWATATLARLSLPEKLGQMIGVRMSGLPRHPSSPPSLRIRNLVQKLKVGTVVVF